MGSIDREIASHDGRTRTQVQSVVDSHRHWYHQIEVAAGVVTPGIHESKTALSHLESIGLPLECSGMRVLDIGCRDGFFSFEMERRGASAVGIDYVSPDSTGFVIAQRLLGSRAQYLVQNVYDLSPQRNGMFDLVLFLGVLYHLRNPMRSLDVIRSVLEPGGMLFVETHLLDNHVLLEEGAVVPLGVLSDAFVGLPIMRFYPRETLKGDPTTKWAPNMVCLKAMVEEAQFRVSDSFIYHSRGYLSAVAINDEALEASRSMDSGQGFAY